MTTTKRAIKGGEFGANNEWYEGGKFIATTERPKTEGSKPKKASKQEIAPYKWEMAPSANHRSIYKKINAIFGRMDENGLFTFSCHEETLVYLGLDREICERFIAAYNGGQRWFEVDPSKGWTPII